VAVGRPGEKLPQAGARRLYLPDEKWQEGVLDLIERSSLVVLVLGSAQGLLWELRQTVRKVQPRELLLIVPIGAEKYAEFRDTVAKEFDLAGQEWSSSTLPDYPFPRPGHVLNKTFPFIIHFDKGFVGKAVPLDLRKDDLDHRRQIQEEITRALRLIPRQPGDGPPPPGMA
jgi:hypothetical protein